MLELKRRDEARVQTHHMVEFVALSSRPQKEKLKIWSFHVVVVQGRPGNVQKNVMHEQSCFFAY